MAEHPSEAVVAERLREYLSNRLTEATLTRVGGSTHPADAGAAAALKCYSRQLEALA